MLSVMRNENPQIVEEMLLEGATEEKEPATEEDKTMQEDLAKDMSLEAKIEREVTKHIEKA